MPNEIRTVCYDTDLQIEAYRFEGIMQKFPNHFHDYYVIGFIEEGQRYLQCNHQDYIIHPGDILIFNPRDIHSCEQIDEKVLDYRCINIQPDRMRQVVLEITGRDYLPDFTHNVICRSELASSLQELHHMICEGETDFVKEELFFFLIGQLMQDYSDTSAEGTAQERDSEFQAVCDYMETNFFQKITLDELSGMVGLSKYHFLRSFTRQRGISPYNYLETIRIGKAKKLLEQGIAPVDAAHQTGFSDQSHFTNFFKRFIGLTPRQYMRIFLHANPVERSAPKEDV
ncbi:AraC family transcriptional regulator [Paenibacillus tyrfis]|uniref:AraC family transcriptional regulator n=1 Tax=Paenibacillus tyrfis TaxID=1501230 RepID=UPI0024917207|nr:AraC family transcriptional regulator [Paenibacillus tyrfis]GLI08029.1 AraC family transcriptional regulator [Paenibacillus tyrfis]